MKTSQGNIPIQYHHIDAPTHINQQLFDETKKRKLLTPSSLNGHEIYRSTALMYLRHSDWCYKRKLDGENQRVWWNGEQVVWNGKSNAYNCKQDWVDYMNNTFQEELFEEIFGRDRDVMLYGERMGQKVQENELGLDHTEFILFDVCVNGQFLGQDAINEIGHRLGINTCFDFMQGADMLYVDTLDNLILACERGDFKDWEGIVAQPMIELRDQKGERIVTKIKTRDYYTQ